MRWTRATFFFLSLVALWTCIYRFAFCSLNVEPFNLNDAAFNFNVYTRVSVAYATVRCAPVFFGFSRFLNISSSRHFVLDLSLVVCFFSSLFLSYQKKQYFQWRKIPFRGTKMNFHIVQRFPIGNSKYNIMVWCYHGCSKRKEKKKKKITLEKHFYWNENYVKEMEYLSLVNFTVKQHHNSSKNKLKQQQQ